MEQMRRCLDRKKIHLNSKNSPLTVRIAAFRRVVDRPRGIPYKGFASLSKSTAERRHTLRRVLGRDTWDRSLDQEKRDGGRIYYGISGNIG